jgi:tetratricopeptide (TPR) repeat protein
MLAVDSENRPALNNMATALLRLGSIKEAIPVLEHVLRTSPNAASYINLGLALSYLNKGAVALPYFETACTLQPDSFYTGMLAHAYRWAGMKVEASKEYQIAIKLAEAELRFEGSAETYANLALYYAAMGDREHFDKNIAKALASAKMMSPMDLHYKRAVGFILLGDYDKASEILRPIVKNGFPMAFEFHNPDLAPIRSRFSENLR